MKTDRFRGLVMALSVLVVGCGTTGNLLDGHAPTNRDGTINVVVEIPTGTNAKWEVEKETGVLKWEYRNGRPRIVKYLGYPGNYGMIPRTLLAEEAGGDGDPLDVIVLGPALERGSVISARLIGVLKTLDGGEKDDKLVAVAVGSPFEGIRSIEQLDREFKGVTDILETWFSNYKGPGEIVTRGFAGPNTARNILNTAAKAYRQ